jgi:hypothetical protein
MIMMIAAGGAFNDSRERRLINDASKVAGRCLHDKKLNMAARHNTGVPTKNSRKAQSSGRISPYVSDEGCYGPEKYTSACRTMGNLCR